MTTKILNYDDVKFYSSGKLSMRITDAKKQEIASTFQQVFKQRADAEDQSRSYSLIELRQTDEMLGNRDVDAGYRIAIRNRIKDLDAEKTRAEQRVYESKIRGWNLVTGILIGLLIAFVSKSLFS